MSLTVSPELAEQAEHGEIDDAAFTGCIAASLPYAWQLISGLITKLNASEADFADNQVPPPDEAARGQLLRVMASDARRPTRSSSPRIRRSATSARSWSTADPLPGGPGSPRR